MGVMGPFGIFAGAPSNLCHAELVLSLSKGEAKHLLDRLPARARNEGKADSWLRSE
jgi:hypothetical protein